MREGGRCVRPTARPPRRGIPEGLRDVIGKRLLAAQRRDATRCSRIAAVIGRDFRLDVLQAVAGLPEERSMRGARRSGGAGRRSRSATAWARWRFRFTHAFFRQTLYEEMFAPRRIRLHQQVGARAGGDLRAAALEEHAAELAEHFATVHGREDLAKAVHYGELAAQRAMASSPTARRCVTWSRRSKSRRCSTQTTR